VLRYRDGEIARNETQMKFDLEDRLVDFSVSILTLAEQLPETRTCIHLSNQIIRSCTGPALIYGEAQGAESRRDFIHKMKVALKELRETRIALKVISKKKYLKNYEINERGLAECNELIAIFVKSILTATGNMREEQLKEKRRNSRGD
jgi:four helix bundle protein